jgi:hypothetical protein
MHPANPIPRAENLHPGETYLLCLPPQPPLVVTLLAQAPCPAVVIVADEHQRRFPVDRLSLYPLPARPAGLPGEAGDCFPSLRSGQYARCARLKWV